MLRVGLKHVIMEFYESYSNIYSKLIKSCCTQLKCNWKLWQKQKWEIEKNVSILPILKKIHKKTSIFNQRWTL
jgi:hypothetical protein